MIRAKPTDHEEEKCVSFLLTLARSTYTSTTVDRDKWAEKLHLQFSCCCTLEGNESIHNNTKDYGTRSKPTMCTWPSSCDDDDEVLLGKHKEHRAYLFLCNLTVVKRHTHTQWNYTDPLAFFPLVGSHGSGRELWLPLRDDAGVKIQLFSFWVKIPPSWLFSFSLDKPHTRTERKRERAFHLSCFEIEGAEYIAPHPPKDQ